MLLLCFQAILFTAHERTEEIDRAPVEAMHFSDEGEHPPPALHRSSHGCRTSWPRIIIGILIIQSRATPTSAGESVAYPWPGILPI